jgi:hypothetical protein
MRVAINENAYLVADLKEYEYVFVKPGGSSFGEVSGVVTRLYAPDLVEIHLHLEDDHPAMQDFIADNEDEDGNPTSGVTRDQAEFYDIVAISSRERGDGTRIMVGIRRVTNAERAERARRRGFERLSLPELDAGLRR